MFRLFSAVILSFSLSGCIVGTVAGVATDVVVGTASIATDVVVGTVDITTDVVGTAVGVVTPDFGDDAEDAPSDES